MAAKFCGSGGAVVIIPGFSYREETIESLRMLGLNGSFICRELEQNNFVFVKVNVFSRSFFLCLTNNSTQSTDNLSRVSNPFLHPDPP